jgi:AraC-like DNA-binding protein
LVKKSGEPFRAVIRTISRSNSRITILEPTPEGRELNRHPPLVTPQRHKHYELVICYSGEVMIVSAARFHILKAGEGLLVRPGAWHYETYCRTGRPYQTCWLIEAGPILTCNLSTYRRGRFHTSSCGGSSLATPVSSLVRLAREIDERRAHWQLKTRSFVTELLVDLERSISIGSHSMSVQEMDPFQKAIRTTETRFREPIQIKTLAREVGFSPNYLSHRFVKATGMTFKKYLNSLRIHHAQLLLRAGHSLKVTADQCGFQNVYYFSRVFSRWCSMPPGRYARKVRMGSG